MNLVPLFEEALEFQDYNGTVLSDGKIAVYYIGRTRLADIYEDVAGEYPAQNPRILNNLGMGPVYVNPAFDYEMVVFDAYGSELFSVKKYLASKGEHSTANVVVTPSESIAVSAWTVGDVQVYMPYLTGQLGKVYEGIDPIVVNNQVDKISANHVPLGVQDPLYFVQDDEEGCIIGCSAQTEIPSALSGKWDEASDAVIANSAQWSEGTTYEAGSYVDIDGHTINVTGLQPAGNYQSAGDYVVHDELSSYATQDWVENQSYMKEYMESAFYPSTSNPSGYLTAHQDISDKLDTTAFSTVSGDFLTAIPSEYVTENTLQSGLSSKLDSTAFSTVSGDFLTAHQSLDGLMSADLLEFSDNKITGYNGTAFAGTTVSGDFELSAGSGISIVDYPLEQKTVISVTAQGGNPEVEQAVIDNSATWDSVTAKQDSLSYGYHDTAISSIDNSALYDNSAHARINTLAGRISDLSSNKLDTTAFSDVSGTFLTAHQDLSDYQTTAGMTAYQEAGDYLTTADSANFYTTANESGFITGVDLTPYQLTADMTAYQPVGDYLTTADSANFYTTANESGFISEVPDTYLQNTDLSTEDGKVTAISGIPLSAGGDVPEGVMVESAVEYNAVNEISGYNGSAIAQYGAEKQWLQHDDTIVHVSNSAQYAFGCNISALQRLMGIDETLLYSGSLINATANLNEDYRNFEKIKVVFVAASDNSESVLESTILTALGNRTEVSNFLRTQIAGVLQARTMFAKFDGNVVSAQSWYKNANVTGGASQAGTGWLKYVIGIHRLSGEA